MREGVLTTDVGTTYPLDDVRAAVHETAQPGRKGKILLIMGGQKGR